jgi:hypothetical protein
LLVVCFGWGVVGVEEYLDVWTFGLVSCFDVGVLRFVLGAERRGSWRLWFSDDARGEGIT